MDPAYRASLSRQSNKFIGEHTSVQVCGWTKKALRGEGACYKGKFYGIKSHRCVQMSPAVNFCDHDCVFCWRERNNSGFGKIDDPHTMADKSIDAQRHMLNGFGGNVKVDKEKLAQAQDPLHFAISLNGEPTYYPRMNEFLKDLKGKNMSSFLVSNGQLPEVLEKIEMPTQLYVSLDVPTPELYESIDKPMRKDGWERLMRSLDVLKKRKHETRTCIRVTLIKEMNDLHLDKWAALLKRADPMIIEIKGYVFVGASRQRLSLKNMPYHEEVMEFSKKIAELTGYVIASDHAPSKVALLMKPGTEMQRFIKYAPVADVHKHRGPNTLPKLNLDGTFIDSVNDAELTLEKADSLIKIK